MNRLLQITLLGLALLVAHPALAQEDVATFGDGRTQIKLHSTTDIGIVAPVMQDFVSANPDLSIRYEQWGSNDLFANSGDACEGRREPADAVWSSAVQQMVWLVNAACAHAYHSSLTTALPPERRWRDEVWGITEEPAVIIYNKRAISGDDVPRSRFDLLDMMRARPEFLGGRIATYDIDESGLGYLFAHIDSLEATSFGAMIESFARVGAVATCCSNEIIDAVAEGRFLLAYNVLGSYVSQELDPDVGVVLPEDYTLILSRAYMIPKGAAQTAGAERLLDFLLSATAQEGLSRAGLTMISDREQIGLLPSARRLIALSPALLVALDRHRRADLFTYWQDAFDSDRAD
ncbi:ABC transporter substrate-binding protein [Paracoccus tegillarcae]|uniref:Iron-binding protein n=1 Tax=Paracoccus tegillarcae TaxID=1529068 RepID=A0A2K9ENF9_9RHOB|nr:ABC transporter substrate-binding protein [Paracoccus tegillarcae]AUH32236.1 iron-binding protein [Paracoccus tegillarcae]